MIFLDLILCTIIFVVVLMVLCGVFSLCERKVLALVQLRVGPGLFLFGILTPITDGIKLFVKFVLFVISFDVLYFIIALYITVLCMYFIWFFVPLGYIIIFDISFSVLLLIAIHMINNVFSIFMIGCFLFTSCFIYLAAMRALFFSIITEGAFSIALFNFYVLDFFSFFSIKNIAVNQLFIMNIFFIGLLFFFIFCIIILLDGLRIPFDYLECESELVAGIITEFSGFFFILYSLMEINHLLLSSLLIVALCFGGVLMTLKSLLILLIVFLFPRALGCRLKITTAQTFILVFLFSISFVFFLWIAVTKILTLVN